MTRTAKTKRNAKPKQSVKDFVISTRNQPVRGQCYVCHHTDRRGIEADCRKFLAAQKKCVTSMTFASFTQQFIRKHYEYTAWGVGLQRHMEKCCDTKTR